MRLQLEGSSMASEHFYRVLGALLMILSGISMISFIVWMMKKL
jgi:hypothetical protein